MREEWVFILSTCSVIVKLRGLWCDMTGDCFKCPHQWNGWTCLGVIAKTPFTYITCRYLLYLVNSCGSLPRQNECVCVCVSWCERVHMYTSTNMQGGYVYASRTQWCTYEFLYLCAFRLFPERTCRLWSTAQSWRGSFISMIGEQSSSSKYLAKREQPL